MAICLCLLSVAVIILFHSILASVRPEAHYENSTGQIILANPSAGRGLIFYTAAGISPLAYADTLDALRRRGFQVVIVKSPLNLAYLSSRSVGTIRSAYPEVRTWYVGGHSMGAGQACRVAAADRSITNIVLFAGYCSKLPARDKVIVLAGGQDHLEPIAKIEATHPDSLISLQTLGHLDFANIEVTHKHNNQKLILNTALEKLSF